MKAVGIVRRIDELGRIVLPKEIRRTMRIESGDEMEIYVSGKGEIVLLKYSSLEAHEQAVKDCCNALASDISSKVLVTDRYRVIAESGEKNNEKSLLSMGFLDNVQKNGDMVLKGSKVLKVKENETYGYKNQGIFAVNRNGILHGSVVIESNNDINSEEVEKAKLISKVISENIGDY